jgi:hypothetical protein
MFYQARRISVFINAVVKATLSFNALNIQKISHILPTLLTLTLATRADNL